MRVLTWNVWWRFQAWESRQAALLAAVSAVAPDVVLLQETWPEQTERIAQASGLAVVGYGGYPLSSVPDPADAEVPFGNAILAAPGTMSEAVELVLPAQTGRATRSALAATAAPRLPGGPELLVAVTHLASPADEGEARQKQMLAIVDWVDAMQPHGPILLGGDLNQTPTSPEYAASLAPHWDDLWATAHPDEPGSTMVHESPHVAKTGWIAIRNGPAGPEDGVRFDYLLLRDGGGPGSNAVGVTSMAIVGDAADGWPSDHLGVVADLEPLDAT